ncbi:hypothetical protein GQF42_16000 [Streptomyces broussonetiae]|uniref:Uncharacterized protein n=1 Tax=Streptomyces broussonetiae TaxID=2686304 RepID=A0A6I6MW60_9ACTN|nr:hypothetical protein [Streptomyces broussonetiae]QHA04593.1 hypothetical protein GQF42_16000 [Streptomyces broussonetiae]
MATQTLDISGLTPSRAVVDGALRQVLIPAEQPWYDKLLVDAMAPELGGGSKIFDRFNAKIHQGLNSSTIDKNCWTWMGQPTSNGYGIFNLDGHKVRAHHILWTVTFDLVPVLAHVDDRCQRVHVGHQCHDADPTCPGGRCRHRLCVRVEHLALQTHAANDRAGHSGEHHRRKTHCPSDHAYAVSGYSYTDPQGTTRRYCRACKAGERAPEFVGIRKQLVVA